MNIIREANKARIGCLGKQKILNNKNYRPLVYTTNVRVNEGFLLYNNLTDELIFLTERERAALDDFNINIEICKALIEKWYFVPQEHCDFKLCDELNNFMNLLNGAVSNSSAITDYTIFPTTDCNARCFYCYEKGVRRIHMSDKTALDTADYIIKHSKGNKIQLRWFGGEPLYNSKAIDIISERLRGQEVKFFSSMVSNGYLFDDEIIEKAVNLWNLKRVQITLDGTEEKYNKIKAFIYPNVNAYERVISNIEKLLNADIFVIIRMNMDKHNYDNLFELVTYLCDKFKDYKNLRIYSQTLFDESSQKHMDRTDTERDDIFKNNHTINEYIKNLGLSEVRTLNRYLKENQCMADNDSATTITPEGNLGKCEHFSDRYFWGSIYSDEINSEYINMFKKKVPLTGKCNDCPVKPACLQLEACPNGRRCNETLQKSHFKNLENRIINTYNQWKEKQ